MDDLGLICGDENRRDDVRAADLYGFDYVEVDEGQLGLTVYFLGPDTRTIAHVGPSKETQWQPTRRS